MDFTWIVVGLAGWALALLFVLLLMRMAGQQDRAARHGEKRLHPFSDVTVTRIDGPKFTTACGGESPEAKSPATAGSSREIVDKGEASKESAGGRLPAGTKDPR